MIGKEGVVGSVSLDTDQESWYKMTDTAAPHVSLALNPGHEARELGRMTKRLLEADDWVETSVPNVVFRNK